MHKDAAHMAHMRFKRGPGSAPRDSRIFRQIRYRLHGTSKEQKITTRYLLSFCYGYEFETGQIKPWMRRQVIAVAIKVAIPIRNKSLRGRVFIWEPIEELLEIRPELDGSAARMRSKRRLPTDPRNGRIFEHISRAFIVLKPGEKATTRHLLQWCYPAERMEGILKPWMRRHVIAQAPARWRSLADPRGRAPAKVEALCGPRSRRS